MISHLEVRLPDKSLTPKNIGETLKDPQRQFCEEYLYVQYDKNKNGSLLSAPTPFKLLHDVTKVVCLLNAPNMKECYFYLAQKFVARHFSNGSYHIKGIDFDP